MSGIKGFVNLDAEEASRQTAKKARPELTEIYLDRLRLTDSQRQDIDALYTTNKTHFRSFSHSKEDQYEAALFLAANRLDDDGRECVQNKWHIRWTGVFGRGSSQKDGKRETRRVLYQWCANGRNSTHFILSDIFPSACGYDHTIAGVKERRNPVNYTGCLAHGEVIYETATNHVLMIRGFFEHNSECRKGVFARKPLAPIHPSVFNIALRQMTEGVSLEVVKERNREMVEKHLYPDMPPNLDTSDSEMDSDTQYRWLLRVSDIRSLYRQLHRLQGIKVTVRDYVNIHEWLDPNSPRFNKALHEAVFHYSPRLDKGERFEICISTPEMREAAWKYGHHNQILLDGTFGVCDKKMLLFIAMGVDEANRGVPLAFFLFSAPSENKKTSAGYDTDVLERMLTHWKTSQGSRNEETFEPLVGITDTDLMERGALLRVFPRIWLLICRFHLRQSWKNNRVKAIKGNTTDHAQLKGRAKRLENALVETENHAAALDLIAAERRVLNASLDPENADAVAIDAGAIEGALEHLRYLEEYWMREALWQSWSRCGHIVAAQLLGRDVDKVIPTTNHLESFNSVLKRKHIGCRQKGGRKLRLDVLLHIFVFSALPSIFKQRQLEDREAARRQRQYLRLAGGKELVQRQTVSRPRPKLEPIAYYIPDERRDAAAALLVEHRQISIPALRPDHSALDFNCYSALASEHDPSPVLYAVSLGFHGEASCSCPDFKNHGGFCKHLRAALLRINQLRAEGGNIPLLLFPTSANAAYALRAEQLTRSLASALVSGDGIDSGSEVAPSNQTPITSAVDEINALLHSFDDLYIDSMPDPDATKLPRLASESAEQSRASTPSVGTDGTITDSEAALNTDDEDDEEDTDEETDNNEQ